jgi:ABC-type uncharacterized transport system involved in gliding motility auxiliary subunit
MSRAQALLAALAILATAFFVNLITSAYSTRVDLTEDRTFTLSAGSIRIIKKLDEPVTLELFVSRSDVKLRPYLESYSRRIETLLREYAAASEGKIKLIVTDPKPDTKDEQRAQRFALNAMNAANGAAYFGLTAQQADTVKAINFFDPAREKFLEYDLSKLITAAARLEKPKLVIVNTLSINNSLPQGGQQQQAGPADVLLSELGQTFEVVTLSNQAPELPAGTAAVALIHPHHLADKLAYAVDQFLLNGGSVFVAADPLSRFQKFQQGGMPFSLAPLAMGASSDPALLQAWGVNVELNSVLGDSQRSVPIRSGRGEPMLYPPAFSVGPEDISKESALTANFKEISFMEAGEINLMPGAEKRLQTEKLVTLSGPNAGTIETGVANAGPFEKAAEVFKSDGRVHLIGASFTGTFPTAFPQGAPVDKKKPEEKSDNKEKKTALHLTTSAKPGRLIVFADSDFMLDPFTVRQRQANGQIVAEEINDNLKLVLNIMETLGGSDELVTIRSKGTSLRPFKVVDQMQRSAQKRYQAQLDKIEKSIEETQTKLNEIMQRSGADPSKGLVITPEIQKEIEKFQKRADELAEERRIIRRGLSEDVNSLGRRLQILNLLIGPAIAGLFGLLYALYRRRQSA